MPTLNWIGKDAVVNHHREVPYHLLRCDEKLSVGDPGSGNLLVQGDNLLALKALLPYYAGQVKCIYIDPPYNTGKEGWVYNDNVNSPEIRQWLGTVVGKEAEDLSRHDKWLCMMYPRLAILHELLADDGVIFISIGKDEVANLRTLCDAIFDRTNLLEIFIWSIEGNTENQEDVTAVHEYVLAYAKESGKPKINRTIDPNIPDDSKLRRRFTENSVVKNGRGNPASVIELPRGFPCEVEELTLPKDDQAAELIAAVQKGPGWIRREMRAKFGINYPARLDEMVVRNGTLTRPCRIYSGWSSAKKARRFIAGGCRPLDDEGTKLRYFLSKTGVLTYHREREGGHFVSTILRGMGTTERASNELERMGLEFDYPKPVGLVKYLCSLYTRPGDLVLDSFCGSGTTGEAILRLGNEDDRRRFICIEMDPRTASDIAAVRLGKVVGGYVAKRGRKTVEIPGTGGGFRYCRLSHPIFDHGGQIHEKVRFAELASHVFFTETGEPIPKRPSGKQPSPLLGVCNGTAVYLLFNGVLGDKRPDGGNVLTSKVLEDLPAHDGPKVIYGEGCPLGGARLRRNGITFKQVPYEIGTL